MREQRRDGGAGQIPNRCAYGIYGQLHCSPIILIMALFSSITYPLLQHRFEVLEETVPIVYNLKNQEALVFSIVCERALGSLGMHQTLYPTQRFINMEGPLMRSKALLGSVTEKYYYAISGNVLYEYYYDKGSKGRKNDNLRMVVPLADLTVMYNVGRDIVLKGPKGRNNIQVATRSQKWGVGQALENINSRFNRARHHMRAEEEHMRSGAWEDVGGSDKLPLQVSSREELVFSSATGEPRGWTSGTRSSFRVMSKRSKG